MNWMPPFQLRVREIRFDDKLTVHHNIHTMTIRNTFFSKISINKKLLANSHTINVHQSIVNLYNLLIFILLLVKIGRENLWSRLDLETFALIEKIVEGIFVIALGFDLAALSSTTPRRSGCWLRSFAFHAVKETCKRCVSQVRAPNLLSENTWCEFFSWSENSRKIHDPNLLHSHFGGTVLNPRFSANHLAKNRLSFILETSLL